ncbi:protein BTG4 [Chelonoidis abingdonii]|uniref:protein BTG4 n=1 Tax=Chelonoidis abingdonii TaxID=106734 RepID=UPI003F4940D2
MEFDNLGLPQRITHEGLIQFDVGCRYGEKNLPFTVVHFEGAQEDRELSQRISHAVDRATSDSHSGTSSDEEGYTKKAKAIPTVSNPNSVYQFSDYCKLPIQPWSRYPRKKTYATSGLHQASVYYAQHKGFKCYWPMAAFSGPRMDRYHWVNTNR